MGSYASRGSRESGGGSVSRSAIKNEFKSVVEAAQLGITNAKSLKQAREIMYDAKTQINKAQESTLITQQEHSDLFKKIDDSFDKRTSKAEKPVYKGSRDITSSTYERAVKNFNKNFDLWFGFNRR